MLLLFIVELIFVTLPQLFVRVHIACIIDEAKVIGHTFAPEVTCFVSGMYNINSIMSQIYCIL